MGKWPSESLRVQASTMKKKAREAGKPIPTYEEIMKIFHDEGKIKAIPKQPPALEKQKLIDSINTSATRAHDETPPHNTEAPLVTSITEQAWEQYLIRLMNECDPTPQIAAQIRDFLDKKGAINAKKQTRLPIAADDHAIEFSEKDSAICP